MRFLRLIFVAAAAYQVLAVFAGLRHLRRRRIERHKPPASSLQGVSVLKPLRGLDPNTYEAFVSQIQQDFPNYEVLFGVRDLDDPAALEVLRLQREYPSAPIRLVGCQTESANGKVGVLADLLTHARYPICVVNDSDIKVTPEYLRAVTAPLADPSVGVVTCLYRAKVRTIAATWEALGIATDFMPSTLVAQLLGVREFGLGSTLAFRAEDLKSAGGFEAISTYLADDYHLAKRIASLGKRVVLSPYIVETALGEGSWSAAWHHQLRWARTIRLSKGGGYAGLPLTYAGLWMLIAFLCGDPLAGMLLLALRATSALTTGWFVLRSPAARSFWFGAPFWDLYAFAIWIASYGGREVRWRDRILQIDSEGRILC